MEETTRSGPPLGDYVELRELIAVLWRRKWLIVVATLLAVIGAYVVSGRMIPVYEASTLLFVSKATDPLNNDPGLVPASERLALAYAEMLTTRPMLDETLASLELGVSSTDPKLKVSAQLVKDTQLIELNVRHTNPLIAAAIANKIVEVFGERFDSLQTSRFAASKASLSAQLDKLSEQIREAEDQAEALSSAQLDKLSEQIREAEDQVEALSSIEIAPDLENEAAFASLDTLRADSLRAELERHAERQAVRQADSLGAELERRLAGLTQYRVSYTNLQLSRRLAELTQYRVSYTNLLLSFEELRMAEALSISNIIQVEPAEPPGKPVLPRTLLNTLLAAVAGGMIAVGIVFVIERLDDTLRTPEDVARAFQLPIIGFISTVSELKTKGRRQRLLIDRPNSALAESFRSLRTNIEFAGVQGTPRSILVASPAPGDGSTTIAAQLAISMAQGGKRVLLLDANLRRPGLHGFFGIKNELGLADMLIDDLVPQVVAKELIHWRLKVITSGKKAENPAELMGSIKMLKVLTRLREEADVAIFDGPPFLVAETFILASKLESVLIVTQAGRTREGTAVQIMEQLEWAKANLFGIVMNRVPDRMAHGLAGNLVYGYGADPEEAIIEGDKKKRPRRPVVLRSRSGPPIEETGR